MLLRFVSLKIPLQMLSVQDFAVTGCGGGVLELWGIVGRSPAGEAFRQEVKFRNLPYGVSKTYRLA